jgi:signal transduction histidine kinase
MLAWLRNFFELNDEIVLFVYGQVFFVLGLAIALQTRRHSRLELARSLRWLALFGFSHGFHEWGLLLVPIQAAYLSADVVSYLVILRTILLGISFAALFQFSATLLRDKWPWLRPVPAAILTLWIVALTILGLGAADLGQWEQVASVWARYFIAMPGALLAAWGLRVQAEQQIKPLQLDHIYNVLRWAGVALAAYAVFAGLIGPYAEFFPANRINQSLLVEYLGVPIQVFRSLIGLILSITIIRALEVFDVETDRLIEQMEVEQSLSAERERIGRELHDGAIQRVYTAGLIIESARSKIEDDTVIGQRLDRAMNALNEAIDGLRAYMTGLRAAPAPLSLADGLRERANDPQLKALFDVRLDLQLPESAGLDPAQTTHVLAIVGEALSNVARHAQATRAYVRARRANGHLLLVIEDDGSGFDGSETESNAGYGLRNMRDRARLLDGDLSIESAPGRGTRVTLEVPWGES